MLSWELKCPHCGGPNDVGTDRNCLACKFCGAGLWVQLPAGYPTLVARRRVKRSEAVYAWDRQLKEAGEPLSRGPRAANCVYLPFWRVSTILAVPRLERRVKSPATSDYAGNELDPFVRLVQEPEEVTERCEWEIKPWDMSMPAFDGDWGLATLGIRIETVPLTGWDRVALDQDAVCLPVAVSEPIALERIRKTVESVTQQSPHKPLGPCHLIAPKLALIYWPVWRLQERRGGKGRSAEVDAVSGKLIRHMTGERDVAEFESCAATGEAPALSPHRCLNCGRDLPVDDRYVVYLCSNCHTLTSHESTGKRQIVGSRFALTDDPLNQNWYPFWSFQDDELLIPAFAIRNYRQLVRFSEIMSGQTRAFGDPPEESFRLKGIVGASLPVDVAAGFASVVLERRLWQPVRAESHREKPPAPAPDPASARLVYTPLQLTGTELIDPVTGLCLSRAALATV